MPPVTVAILISKFNYASDCKYYNYRTDIVMVQ